METYGRYNVIASFPTDERARAAERALVDNGVPREGIVLETGSPAELRAEMQDEVDHLVTAPSFAITREQAAGAAVGTVVLGAIGGLVGLAVGLVWAFAFTSGASVLLRIVLPVIAFGVGGATAGLVAGGAMATRMHAARDSSRTLDDRSMVAESGVQVEVTSDSRDTVEEAAAILRQMGPARVDLVTVDGLPLPPQAGRPRPADRPGQYWDRPGQG